MPGPLFDAETLAIRRKRAERLGPDLFIHDLALVEIIARLALIRRSFQSVLVVGWPEQIWRDRLGLEFGSVTVVEPSADLGSLPVGAFDLGIVLGAIDTADDLPLTLAIVRHALADDALLIGAVPGGETLPQLRAAMRAADEQAGVAAPHVHPRLEAAALAGLLSAAGFTDAVVDIDRIAVSYESLSRLLSDLRRMAATNVLHDRPRKWISKRAFVAAETAFAAAGYEGRTTETFELLHFAGWTPRNQQG